MGPLGLAGPDEHAVALQLQPEPARCRRQLARCELAQHPSRDSVTEHDTTTGELVRSPRRTIDADKLQILHRVLARLVETHDASPALVHRPFASLTAALLGRPDRKDDLGR